MQFLIFTGLVLLSGLVLTWLLLARRHKALPLFVQVEDEAENVEWLLMALLRHAPRRHLVIIDHTRGENRRILRALARRYHISAAESAPANAPVLYACAGVTAQDLLAQYERSHSSAKQTG